MNINYVYVTRKCTSKRVDMCAVLSEVLKERLVLVAVVEAHCISEWLVLSEW